MYSSLSCKILHQPHGSDCVSFLVVSLCVFVSVASRSQNGNLFFSWKRYPPCNYISLS